MKRKLILRGYSYWAVLNMTLSTLVRDMCPYFYAPIVCGAMDCSQKVLADHAKSMYHKGWALDGEFVKRGV